MEKRKLTVQDFREMKKTGNPVAAVVLYEEWTAKQAEKADVNWILVGDSVNMALYGEKSTAINPPTMDCMIKHARAVRMGAPNTFIVGDMPDKSYGMFFWDYARRFLRMKVNYRKGVKNAKRFIDEAHCDAIKLEGGIRMADQVKAIVDSGVEVMGHIGLTPQTVPEDKWGTVYGETAEEAIALIVDAITLEKAGAFAILLEKVAEECAETITKKLKIPVFSIGAGRKCNGQLLLSCDILGSFDLFKIKFVKRYITWELLRYITDINHAGTHIGFAQLAEMCFKRYIIDVKNNLFPEEKHVYKMKPGEFEKLQKMPKE